MGNSGCGWYYWKSESGPGLIDLWTVGHDMPDGRTATDSDHNDREEAAKRVHYLNGGNDAALDLLAACKTIKRAVRHDSGSAWDQLDAAIAKAEDTE